MKDYKVNKEKMRALAKDSFAGGNAEQKRNHPADLRLREL